SKRQSRLAYIRDQSRISVGQSQVRGRVHGFANLRSAFWSLLLRIQARAKLASNRKMIRVFVVGPLLRFQLRMRTSARGNRPILSVSSNIVGLQADPSLNLFTHLLRKVDKANADALLRFANPTNLAYGFDGI